MKKSKHTIPKKYVVLISIMVIAIILWSIWYFFILLKPKNQEDMNNKSCWDAYDKMLDENPGIQPARCPGNRPSSNFIITGS